MSGWLTTRVSEIALGAFNFTKGVKVRRGSVWAELKVERRR